MSDRVHPWQECNERLEARAAARRWRRRHQHQDAGRCHAGGKATARTAPGTHSAHCLHFPRIAYQNHPALQPQPHASSLELPACTCGLSRRTALLLAPSAPCHKSCTSAHRFALLSPCSTTPPHLPPFAGPSGLRPAQVRPIHSASSPVSQPRPSLQPSCPAENSNPVNERKYQGLCPACAATTAAPLCTASHPLLRRAVPIDRGRTAACTRRRRRR